MAGRVEVPHPKESRGLDWLPRQSAPFEAKREFPGLANPANEDEDLLGPAPASPLDRPLTITRFLDAGSKRILPVDASLRRFADQIRTERADAKSELPWLKLARFGDVRTEKGALRHDANLVAIDGVEGDHDAGTLTVAEACSRLQAAGLAAVVYTTPSHTPERPRWRVLCPTSAPLSPDERDALCARLNGALDGALARESFTRSQAYYYGGVGAAAGHDVRLIEGRFIDDARDLDGRAIGRDGRTEPDEDDLARYREPDWPRIASALAVIPADDRDDWLTVGMALHDESGGSERGFEAWSDWSRQSEKFNERDQRRTWESFGRSKSRVSIGTLFHMADRVRARQPRDSRLSFLTPDQCAALPSRGYVVKGLLAPGDVGCIFGAPGAGKSILSPHLGYAVARGESAFGLRTKPGLVFYVAAEDPHGMRGRVTALRSSRGDTSAFLLVDGVSDLLSPDAPDLAALMEAVESQRPALIFLDTLAMSFPGLEENSAEAMGKVVAVARGLAKHGAAVVLIHHDTKAEGATPRGHSLLNGALDMALHVKRDEHRVIRGRLTKNRNGSCDRDLAFTIESHFLRIDEDGERETAPIARELDGYDAPPPKLAASEQAALDTLRRIRADKSGQSADNGNVRVTEAEWRDACVAGRAVSAADKEESRERIFRRVLRTLAGQDLVRVVDGFVSEPDLLSHKAFFEDLP